MGKPISFRDAVHTLCDLYGTDPERLSLAVWEALQLYVTRVTFPPRSSAGFSGVSLTIGPDSPLPDELWVVAIHGSYAGPLTLGEPTEHREAALPPGSEEWRLD